MLAGDFFSLQWNHVSLLEPYMSLGMSNIDDQQRTVKISMHCSDGDVKTKKDYLYRLSSVVVNTLVIDRERNRDGAVHISNPERT